jgi:hypothetical protein
MKLPHGGNAYVPPEKLRDYLLSETHPVGKAKAKFFRSFGFDETNLNGLEQGLKAIADLEEVVEVTTTPYGTKYVIEGTLNTPSGQPARVRTVWIVEADQPPRFVTAFPG